MRIFCGSLHGQSSKQASENAFPVLTAREGVTSKVRSSRDPGPESRALLSGGCSACAHVLNHVGEISILSQIPDNIRRPGQGSTHHSSEQALHSQIRRCRFGRILGTHVVSDITNSPYWQKEKLCKIGKSVRDADELKGRSQVNNRVI